MYIMVEIDKTFKHKNISQQRMQNAINGTLVGRRFQADYFFRMTHVYIGVVVVVSCGHRRKTQKTHRKKKTQFKLVRKPADNEQPRLRGLV